MRLWLAGVAAEENADIFEIAGVIAAVDAVKSTICNNNYHVDALEYR